MNLSEAIKNRRSIRGYQDREISDEILVTLVESAHWAPSAGNINPRYFLSVKNPHTVEGIKSLSPGMFGKPAVIIVICADRAKAREKAGANGYIYSVIDVSMAAQNLLLTAHALGLGACVVRSFHAQGIGRILGLPEHIVPELLGALGYPAGDHPRGIRPDMNKFYHKERFGGSASNGT